MQEVLKLMRGVEAVKAAAPQLALAQPPTDLSGACLSVERDWDTSKVGVPAHCNQMHCNNFFSELLHLFTSSFIYMTTAELYA